MTTPIDTTTDSIGRPTNATSPNTGYEWTCPYCGKTRLNLADSEAGEKNAIATLRARILASDGDGHGPRSQYPADEALTLSDYVTRVEGSR